jgi:ATP-binding cassette subfamily C protein LapB
LLADLPILDNRLTPALFERAAERAGLETQAVKRKLSDIPKLALPAVLTMKDGSTRVLVDIDRANKNLSIVNPSIDSRPKSITSKQLSADYLGYAFFVRPLSEANPRATAAGNLPKKHWFWSTALRFMSNYSHVGMAALIINALALASPLFIMSVYDRVVPNGALPSLVALGIGMVIAIVFDFVMRMVRSHIIDVTGKKLDVVLSSDIFEHVLAVKMAQRPVSVGILANQMRDFESVKEFFTSGTVV